MRRIIILVFGLLVGITPAKAGEAALPSHIIVKIGQDPPGGFDVAGRIFAKHLKVVLEKKYGTPVDISVENVAAAGGLLLFKQIVKSEKADGSEIALISIRPLVSFNYDSQKYDFKPLLAKPVGSLSKSQPVCLARKGWILASAEASVRIGYGTKGNIAFLGAKIASASIKHRSVLIGGYKDFQELAAALEREEIDLYCGPSYDTVTREGRDRQFSIPFKLMQDDLAALRDVPALVTMLEEDDAEIANLLLSGNDFLHSIFLPPTTEPAVVEAYRALILEIAEDPSFKADLAAGGIQMSISTGKEMDAYVERLIQVSPDIWKRAKTMIDGNP